MANEIMKMGGFAVGTMSLAVVTLTGIAIIEGYKNVVLSTTVINNTTTIVNRAIDNTTADLFIAGLTVFGTFMAIITLAIVGKIIINIVQSGNDRTQ